MQVLGHKRGFSNATFTDEGNGKHYKAESTIGDGEAHELSPTTTKNTAAPGPGAGKGEILNEKRSFKDKILRRNKADKVSP